MRKVVSQENNEKVISLKDKICFAAMKDVFLGPYGGVFDCHKQFSFLLHHSGLFHSTIKRVPDPKIFTHHHTLISVAFRANDFFSHAISVV